MELRSFLTIYEAGGKTTDGPDDAGCLPSPSSSSSSSYDAYYQLWLLEKDFYRKQLGCMRELVQQNEEFNKAALERIIAPKLRKVD